MRFDSHRHLTLVLALLALSISDPTSAAETTYTVSETRDIAYYNGDDADPDKHRLDLYLPRGLSSPPLVMWIHGGAWAFGGRSREAALARQFASQGIAVAAISHRLSPALWKDSSLSTGVQHPAHIVDCARAFAWLYQHAERYGFNRDNIFVSGYSSGAHLASLLATDQQYLKAQGLQIRDLRAAIPIAGAYDLEDYYRDHLHDSGKEFADLHVLGVFGSEDALAGASPANYLNTATVPMLVVSESDTYEYTRLFENRVEAAGITFVRFLHDRERDHAALYRALARPDPCNTREQIINYIFEITANSDSADSNQREVK